VSTHDGANIPAASDQPAARQFEAADADMAGQRLDYALSLLLPQMGLRGRKRCIDSGLVVVNGRSCTAAQRLRKGDVVELVEASPRSAMPAPSAQAEGHKGQAQACGAGLTAGQEQPRFVCRQGDLCFFYKPEGLHTAALTGSTAPSLEGMLPQLLAGQADPVAFAAAGAGQSAGQSLGQGGVFAPQLLQRLDRGTSGIVCAALTPEAAQDFRRVEAAGRCEKRYVALLAGRLEEYYTVRLALRTDKRNKTRVLDCDAGRTRWTEFLPLHYFDGAELNLPALTEDSQFHRVGLTLAGCRIRRGARHQIRAHAAAFGHPLWNDPLYGDGDPQAAPGTFASRFFLHHGGLWLPEASCVVKPSWTFLPETAARRALEWLATGC